MVLVVCHGFWWFFSAFFRGFELLTTKTTVKTKKNHDNSILRDSLKMVVFRFFSWFLQWFWWFVMVFGGFSWLFSAVSSS